MSVCETIILCARSERVLVIDFRTGFVESTRPGFSSLRWPTPFLRSHVFGVSQPGRFSSPTTTCVIPRRLSFAPLLLSDYRRSREGWILAEKIREQVEQSGSSNWPLFLALDFKWAIDSLRTQLNWKHGKVHDETFNKKFHVIALWESRSGCPRKFYDFWNCLSPPERTTTLAVQMPFPFQIWTCSSLRSDYSHG